MVAPEAEKLGEQIPGIEEQKKEALGAHRQEKKAPKSWSAY